MSNVYKWILPIFTILFDLLTCLVGFGLYHNGFAPDLNQIWKTFNVAEYDFFKSPLDFIVLTLLRILWIIVSIILIRYRRKNVLNKIYPFIITICVLMYAYSMTRIIIFDENGEGTYLTFPGMYINVFASILSVILVIVVMKKSFMSGDFDYIQLNEEESRTVESGVSSVSRETSEDKKEGEEEEEEEGERIPLKTHLWLIAKLCSKQWKFYAISYSLLLAECGLNLLDPALYGQMLTDLVSLKPMSTMALSVGLYYLLHSIISLIKSFKTEAMGIAEKRTACHTRIDLFKSILRQEIAFFDTNKTGQLMSRISHDSSAISDSLPKYLETTTRAVITIAGTVPIMLYLSWRLTMIAFISSPFFWMMTKVYGVYVEKLSQKETDATAKSNETVQEVVAAMRTVRSFAAEKFETKRYENKMDDCYQIGKKSVLASAIFDFFWSMTWIAMGFCVYMYGCYLADQKRISAKIVISFIFYHYNLVNTLTSFSSMFTDLMKTIGSSRKVIRLLNRQPLFDLEKGIEEPMVSGKIEFDNVRFAYPTRKNTDILQGLNITFEPGMTTAIVGTSGNGKSTIVSLIQQYYEPKNGRILLDGVEIYNINNDYYHKKIALVAQEPTLFSGTIRENIAYGLENEPEENILRVAKDANVHEFVMKLEKGYDTTCGEKGVQLSGGQKQRIAIARALIRDPAVLILDEATSALDTESEAEVQEALNRCTKNRTVIVIAHRLSTIQKADKIIVIEKGLVAESGTHDELMEYSNGLYRKLISKQSTD